MLDITSTVCSPYTRLWPAVVKTMDSYVEDREFNSYCIPIILTYVRYVSRHNYVRYVSRHNYVLLISNYVPRYVLPPYGTSRVISSPMVSL